LQAERETARQSADEAEASLRSQVEQLTGEREELTTALQASREASASTADTEERLAELTRKFELAVQDAREQKRRNAELEEELASRPASDGSEPAELIAVRSERDRLAERVVELESREPEPVGAGSPDDQVDELQQRFEMAVEDLRDYKLRCSEMEEELAGIRNGGAVAMPASPTGGSLDWEAQKKLLMDGMGGDDESAVEALSEEEQQERLSLQEAIERTERIVADKDRLIAQLERELDEQRSRATEAAQAAANEALSDLLDEDEVIRAERRRLTELQAEWSDKLRQAEIDVSLQRATLARERTELDEKCERFSKQKERFEREIGVAGADEKSGQPSRDRWLSKLGLTRRDEQ